MAVHGRAATPRRFSNSSGGVTAFFEGCWRAIAAGVCRGGSDGRLRIGAPGRTSRTGGGRASRQRPASFCARSAGGPRPIAWTRKAWHATAPSAMPSLRPHHLPNDEQQTLQTLMARRANPMAMRVAEMNRRQHPPSGFCTKRPGHAGRANCHARAAHRQPGGHRTAALAAKMEVMIAIPSVGQQTASTLLAFMPELGMLTRKTSRQPRRMRSPSPRQRQNQWLSPNRRRQRAAQACSLHGHHDRNTSSPVPQNLLSKARQKRQKASRRPHRRHA